MAIARHVSQSLTVIHLHNYGRKIQAFPASSAQIYRLAETKIVLTSGRDEAVEERSRCLFFAMKSHQFTI